MIKNIYYTLFLSLLVISCSSDENLQGDWVLSVESILSTIESEKEIDPTFKPELEQKMIDKIQNNIVYSFLDNGDFELEFISDADSSSRSQKGVWSATGNLLDINISQDRYSYNFDIKGRSMTLVNPLDSTDQFILNKRPN